MPTAPPAAPPAPPRYTPEVTPPSKPVELTSWRGERIAALDGLRGFAVLIVVLFHATRLHGSDHPLDRAVLSLVSVGWTGVDVFFVLSGFLITSILLRSRGQKGYFRAFYVRRCRRILPAFALLLLTLALAFPWLARLDAEQSARLARQFPFLATFSINIAQEVWRQAGDAMWVPAWGTGPIWSLAVEEQFYLAWPLVVALLLPARVLRVALLIAATGPLLRFALATAGITPDGLYRLTVARADALMVGAAIAAVTVDPVALRHLRRAAPAIVLCSVGLFAYAAVTGGSVDFRAPGMALLGFSAAAWCAGGLLLMALDDHRAVRWLSTPWLRHVGRHSYALYLWHTPIVMVLVAVGLSPAELPTVGGSRLASGLLLLGLTMAITYGLARLSWRYVEEPWLRRRPAEVSTRATTAREPA